MLIAAVQPATTVRQRGYSGIAPARSIQRALVAALAVLLFAITATPASAARPKAADYPPVELGPGVQAGPKPHLMLIHGGSFLFEDTEFEAQTREAALKAGFVPHYVAYPLGDMPAAVLAVRAEAKRLREKVGAGMVYAYGSSAGGTLAALLSGDGLVGGAAAKAPVTNLVSWEWPLQQYGPEYFDEVRLDLPARYRLSPLRRPAKEPLLVVHGIDDLVVPVSQSEAFAAKFKRVYLWEVLGGHHAERSQPEVLERTLVWLADVAEAQAQGTIPGIISP